MKLEKWKTSVIGVGPWIVQDHDDPLGICIGQFRNEKHADIFIKALSSQPSAPMDESCYVCGAKDGEMHKAYCSAGYGVFYHVSRVSE